MVKGDTGGACYLGCQLIFVFWKEVTSKSLFLWGFCTKDIVGYYFYYYLKSWGCNCGAVRGVFLFLAIGFTWDIFLVLDSTAGVFWVVGSGGGGGG